MGWVDEAVEVEVGVRGQHYRGGGAVDGDGDEAGR